MNKEQNVEGLNVSPAIAKPMLPAALSVRDANYLIAAFMGYEDFKQTGAVIKDASMKFVLCYDIAWSELMPVVEKIEAIKTNEWQSYGDFYVTIQQCSCRIHKLHNQPVAEANGYNKIEAVFEAVTKFIQYFNANNAAVLGSR